MNLYERIREAMRAYGMADWARDKPFWEVVKKPETIKALEAACRAWLAAKEKK